MSRLLENLLLGALFVVFNLILVVGGALVAVGIFGVALAGALIWAVIKKFFSSDSPDK